MTNKQKRTAINLYQFSVYHPINKKVIRSINGGLFSPEWRECGEILNYLIKRWQHNNLRALWGKVSLQG